MTDPWLLSPGRLNVKNEEIDEMIKEAPGPINFTVFLTMFGEKLKGERAPGEWSLVGSGIPMPQNSCGFAIPTIPRPRDPDLIPRLPKLLGGMRRSPCLSFPSHLQNPNGCAAAVP